MRHSRQLPVALLLCTMAWGQESLAPKPPAWQVSNQRFVSPPGASAPALVKSQFVSAIHRGPARAVSVSFEIGKNGVPFNIQVDHATDTESADEVIALIREWRFEAAMKDGLAVPARGFFDLALGDEVDQPAPKLMRPAKRKPVPPR